MARTLNCFMTPRSITFFMIFAHVLTAVIAAKDSNHNVKVNVDVMYHMNGDDQHNQCNQETQKVSLSIPKEILDKVIHEQQRQLNRGRGGSLELNQLSNPSVADYKESSCAHCGLSVTPHLMQPFTVGELVQACESGAARMIPGACAQMAASWVEESSDPKIVETYSLAMVEKGLVPFATGNRKVDYQLAYGVVLLNTGRYDDAIYHLNYVVVDHPDLVGAYYTRGAAYAKKGVRFPVNAELALQDFTKAIELMPDAEEGWEKRAEVYSALGMHKEAMSDMTKAITIKPTAKLYAHRATVYFRDEDYIGATKDFLESVRINRHQPDIYHLLGLALYHQGKIKEAIKYYNEALKQNANFVDCLRSLAHAYRELGNFEKALEKFNAALVINPNHVQSLQLRGSLLYQAGHPRQALPDFKACTSLEPHNNVCQYMKGLSYAAIGQFYQAIKSNIRLKVLHMPDPGSTEQDRVMYVRELSRYLHAHLDTPIGEYNIDSDLDGTMKDRWVKSKPFEDKGYVELPGLSPEISDVEDLDFFELSDDTRKLICMAEPLGLLGQFEAEGFLPNKRAHMAMGLASIEVAQTMRLVWEKASANRVYRNHQGKRFGWRDVFNIAVKWRRLIDPDQPVLWIDMMPSSSIEAGFNNHMNLLRGQVFNIRFTKYFNVVFNLTKKMVAQHNGMMSQSGKGVNKFLSALDKVTSCDELLKLVKKQNIGDNTLPGFMVSTKMPSFKEKGQRLEGSIISLTGDVAGNVLFSLDTATTKKRTDQFHTEIDYIWVLLLDEMKKFPNTNKEIEPDSVVRLMLSIVYYFYNLMPLSKGSSSVAYSVAVGLILAIGKEVTGRIPKGNIVDVEALLCGSPENFTALMKTCMNIQRASTNITELPLVTETFPTLRTMMEALNAGSMACSFN
ncbi:tetratricopeptide repeat protein 13-like [Asterias rubens]|uniref:tetratricopeptide repeat protein 13-like n=1 Tax=Asterias rubens TaxID=7604 RepID=UPI0014552E45|nr:tetratricopeptide repeat protein 13-like [Asterias rubens]XP_033625889.1 tetratricopeptide repeat protein 13-like [Asterias rubens]XP_033625897.1 tetratricopeptide repeat protein 13-like [Asterias rubens]XP_033625908.1 tetratricopeptide repeat protein 13-like [Asterias rubens]